MRATGKCCSVAGSASSACLVLQVPRPSVSTAIGCREKMFARKAGDKPNVRLPDRCARQR